MHNHTPRTGLLKGRPPGDVSPLASTADLSPLLRMRQLAGEIRAAMDRNDLGVICQAARLLAPTLQRCREVRDTWTDSAGEAAQIAMQTQGLLQECETLLAQAMRQTSVEIRRIRQGRRAIAMARARCAARPSGRTLDTSR